MLAREAEEKERREADEKKQREALWAISLMLVACVGVTLLFVLNGYRQHGHLHVHFGFVLCDAILVAMLVFTMARPPK